MEINNNIIEPDNNITESAIKSSRDIITEDGNYYSFEQIKEAIPFCDESMQKILYLQLNDAILTEEEKERIKLDLQRIKKSNTIRMIPDLEQLKTNPENEL